MFTLFTIIDKGTYILFMAEISSSYYLIFLGHNTPGKFFKKKFDFKSLAVACF